MMLGADNNALLVRMAVDGGQLKQQLDQARRSISGFAGSVRGQLGGLFAGLTVGAAGAFFAAITKNALEAADSMGDLASAVGIPVETLSKFKLAADVSGASLDTLGKGIKELGITMVESLRNPAADSAKAFETLGVEVADTATKALRPTEDVLLDLAEAFSGMADGAQKTALAADVFGKKIGPQLVPFLNNGKDGLQELTATAEALGLTLDQRTVAAADRTNDMLVILGQVSQGLGNKILKEVLPTLEGMAGHLLKTAKESGTLDKAARGVAAAFKVLVSGGSIVITVFEMVGKSIAGVFAALTELAKGNVSAAWEELKRGFSDANQAGLENEQFLKRLWTETLPAVDEKARALSKAMGGLGNNTAAAKEAIKEYAAAAKLVADLTSKSLGVSGDYVEKLRLLELWYSRNADKTEQYVKAVIELIEAQESSKEIAKQAAEAQAEVAKALEKAADEREKSVQAYSDETQKILEQARALDMEAKQLGLSKDAQAALTIELRNAEIVRLQSLATSDMVLLAGQAEIDAINARIAALQRLNEAEANLAAKGALADAAARTRDQWTRTADQIEQALTDAMVGGFSGGRSIAKSVGDWIANYFKTTVARTIAQSLTGAFSLSLPGVASAGGGAAGASGGGGSLGIIGQLLSGASALGGTLGAGVFGTLGTFGLTAGAGTLGTLSAAGSLIGTGTSAGIGAGLGLGAGALLPYVGIALGVYSLAKRIKDNGGSPALQNFSYLDAAGQSATAPWRAPNLQSSSAYDEALMPIIASVNDIVRALGGTGNQALRYGLFSSVSPDGKGGQTVAELTGAGGPLYVSNVNAGNDTVQARLEAELPRLLLAGLQASDLPAQFADFFAKIDVASATKEQVEQAIATAQTAGEVAKLIGDVGDASVEALASIAELSGGISQLASNLGTYYQEFYSQGEREAMLRGQLTEALAAMNVQLPASRAEFRALVEAQDLSTESGRQTYAALLAVAGAFAELNPEIEAVGEALRSAADIAAERAELERRLLEVQGDTVALRQLELNALDPSNRSLLQRIYALEDEAKAAQEAADQAARVAGERQNLEARLLRALGDTTAIRESELAAVDESNRAILERIYALEDEAAAAAAAANELARVNAQIAQVAAEREGLQTRLLQAQGDTAALRQREMAALDGSNRSLLRQIYLIDDWKRATQSAAQAAADVAREQLSALQPLRDFISDAVDSLTSTGGLAMSPEAGSAFIRQAAETALRTGYLPEREALQKAVQAAEGGFGTFATKVDEQRARIQLAKSLEQIGGVADEQISDAQMALDVANEQLTQLQEINAGIRKLSEFDAGVGTSGLGKPPNGGGGLGANGLGDIVIGPNIAVDENAAGQVIGDAVSGVSDGGSLAGATMSGISPEAMARAKLLLQKNIQMGVFDNMSPEQRDMAQQQALARFAREYQDRIDAGIDEGNLVGFGGTGGGDMTDMEKLIERVSIMAQDIRKVRRQLQRVRDITDCGESLRVSTCTGGT